MATVEQLADVLEQIKIMSGQIAELKNENQTLKLGATETQTRITEYKAKWVAMGNEAQELFKQMQEVKMALHEERVDLGYFQENNALFCGFRELLGLELEAVRETVKKEPDELITPGVPFDSVGKKNGLMNSSEETEITQHCR